MNAAEQDLNETPPAPEKPAPSPQPLAPQGRRVLLLGADGMLGRAWRDYLKARRIDHLPCSHFGLDVTDHKAIEQTLDRSFGLVINCAAYTHVDAAEHDTVTAYEVNGMAPGELARRCANIEAKLLHYSTDYVFEGQTDTPYPTDARPNPINVYGASKELGERLIREAECDHLIIRTSWLFAATGDNFVLRIARLLREGKTVRAATDQVSRPTEANDLVAMSVALLQAGVNDVYHAGSADPCSRFEWTRAVGEAVNAAAQVEPCTADAFETPAKRPNYSVLDLSATKPLVDALPDWRAAVQRVLTTAD